MSAVFWTGTPPQADTVIGETSYPNGGSWVLDITTESGSTQMFLYTNYPSPGVLIEDDPPIIGYDALSEADAEGTAAALQTAVNGLASVTDSTLTKLAVTGQGVSILFAAEEWANYQFNITLPTEFEGTNFDYAQLLTRSPADSVLAQGDIDTVNAAVNSYISGLDTVTDVDTVLSFVTPGTI